MRRLHVLPDLSGGGAERLVLAHCRSRPDVRVATVFGGGPLEPELPDAVLGERRPGRPSLRAFLRLVEAARAADVVHTHLFAGDLWGGLAARLAGRPVVSHEHNVDVDEQARHRAARQLSARFPALTLAVSEAAARHSVAPRIVVVPNGVELGRWAAPWRGGPGLLAVGRRVPQKGFDVLLRALPEGVPLRVVGEGPFAPATPGVSWLGTRDDLPELFASADALVVPSRWEGFGIVALEGMAAGTPVIASSVDGLRDLVGDAGMLVPPEDPVALREAITRVLGDRALRDTLSARGRARAQRYDLQQTFDSWERAGREVVGG